MIQSLIEGIGFGLLLSLVPGPLFCVLIHVSTVRGAFAGILFAAGMCTADLIYACLAIFGLQKFLPNFGDSWLIGTGCALVFIAVGIAACIRKVPDTVEEREELSTHGKVSFLFSGLGLNLINPATAIIWTGVAGMLLTADNQDRDLVLFVASTLSMLLISDIVKAILAERIHRSLIPSRAVWLNRACGAILIVMGIRLLA